jgi:hypothetical protein
MAFGIIYKISSPHTDQVYIGSTTGKYLCCRKAKHIYDYKGFLNGTRHYKSSYELLKYGDCVYDLLERFEYNHVSELRQRESEIMRQHPKRVNKYFSVKQNIKQQLQQFNENKNILVV